MSAAHQDQDMNIMTQIAFAITALCIEIYGLLLATARAAFRFSIKVTQRVIPKSKAFFDRVARNIEELREEADSLERANARSDAGDVPGWVLVVLMTTGLVTALWTIAAPRLSAILRNSLDAMNGIR